MEFALAALATSQVVLIVIIVLATVAMCNGRPSKIYKRMVESAPAELAN